MEPEEEPSNARYVVVAILAIVAVLFAATNGHILGFSTSGVDPSASASAGQDPLANRPRPPLLTTADLALVGDLLAEQKTLAKSDMDDFWADQITQGESGDDSAFVSWAAGQVPTEPSTAVRQANRTAAEQIPQTSRNTIATEWLASHGCRDVWTSFLTQLPATSDGPNRDELDTVLNLAEKLATDAQARSGAGKTRQAPCAPRNKPANADCRCSFPSIAAAMSAAASTYLSARAPSSAAELDTLEKQVDSAGVYQRLELTSDVEAGAYIGYLVGEYFLASHGYEDAPAPSASPTAA